MKYWVYMNGEVPGSFTPEELAALPAFGATTLVCPAEGEILEKNWRHSGEFTDLVQAMKRIEQTPAPIPPSPRDAVEGGALDAMLDSSSARLFRHVTELMKELEFRREEKSLTHSLQRQIIDLKEQLERSREKTAVLETRASGIPQLEDARKNAEKRVAELEALHDKDREALSDLRVKLEAARTDWENAARRLQETGSDLAIRNKLVDKLSRELTEKELTLAKSLAVIRRFEEDLGRICPETAPEASKEAPQVQPSKPPPLPELPKLKPLEAAPAVVPIQPHPPGGPGAASLEAEFPETADYVAKPSRALRLKSSEPGAFTTDEPPPAPPILEPKPAQQPDAHGALLSFIKKCFGSSYDH